jgi:hypothetical protein
LSVVSVIELSGGRRSTFIRRVSAAPPATVGGNLSQRTRCAYFYDVASGCNKAPFQRPSPFDALDPVLPAMEKMTLVLEGIGGDKVRLNAASLDTAS